MSHVRGGTAGEYEDVRLVECSGAEMETALARGEIGGAKIIYCFAVEVFKLLYFLYF